MPTEPTGIVDATFSGNRSAFFHVDYARNHRTVDLHLFDDDDDDDDQVEKHRSELNAYLGAGRPHYFRREFNIRPDMKGFQLRERVSVYVKSLGQDRWLGKQHQLKHMYG